MSELKRVVFNLRSLMVVCILLLLNVFFGLMQCDDTKALTKTGEELTQYLEGYQDYVKGTLDNATKLAVLGMFGDEDSYSHRNILKTYEDFERMQDIEVSLGENRGVIAYTNLDITAFLLAGFGVMLVLMFTDEYKKGLNLLTFSTMKGRRTLGAWRVGILAGTLLVMAVAMYLSNILVVDIMYPFQGFDRPIQSVPEFYKCTLRISIGEYLVILGFIKYLGALSISLLFLALISIFRNSLGGIIAGVILLIEAILNSIVAPMSRVNHLRFLNIFNVLKQNDGFLYYLNLNMFGKPMGLLKVQVIVVALMICSLALISIIAMGFKEPEGVPMIRSLADRISRFFKLKRPCLPRFMWEAHKILWSQGGILILIFVMYLAISASLKTNYADFTSRAEIMYYDEYKGPISVEKYEEVAAYEKKLTKYYNNALSNIEKYSANPVKYGEQLDRNKQRVRELELKLPALRRVLANLEYGAKYEAEHGKQLSLVKPFSYDMLLRLDYKTYYRNLLYCFLCEVLIFSGVMTYEKKSGTVVLLRSQPYGRGAVNRNKLLWVLILAGVVSVPVHLIQFVLIGRVMPYDGLDEVVQSIEILRDFPLRINIRYYLWGLYAVRALMAAAVGAVVMLIGRFLKSRVTCIVVCTTLLLVAFLCYII